MSENFNYNVEDNEDFDNLIRENQDIISVALSLSVKCDNKKEKEQEEEKEEPYYDKKRLSHVTFYKREDGKLVYINDFFRSFHMALKKDKMACPINAACNFAWTQYQKHMYKIRMNSKPKKVATKTSNFMPFEKAYDIFVNQYLANAFKEEKKAFDIDKYNKGAIEELVKYFIKDDTCKIPLNKGIGLIGNVGTGKSSLMFQFSKFTRDYRLPTSFHFVTMDSICEGIEDKGLNHLSQFRYFDICIDEYAQDDARHVNSYGTKVDCFRQITKRRYNRWANVKSNPTHMTSNIDFNADMNASSQKEAHDIKYRLYNEYGKREVTRIKQMYFLILLNGPNRR